MKKIEVAELKTKFREIMELVSGGDTFSVVDNGREVARLVPPVKKHDRAAAMAAAEQLIAMAGTIKGVTVEEIIEWKNEGRK